MARDRFYPMMRMFDPDEIFNSLTMGLSQPFFEEKFPGFSAKLDVYRKDGKIFVEAELPGINPDEVDLHVYSDRLTLSAEKKAESQEENKEKSYFRSERRYGKIERVVSFPVEADPDSANASFKNGVLTIEVAHKKVSITAE